MTEKILIIRFSSFGDIVHCMSVLQPLKEKHPSSEIHWITRSDFSDLVGLGSEVNKVWSFERKRGLWGLIKLAFRLRKEGFTKIYDAHSNVRSRVLSLILCPLAGKSKFTRRGKQRLKRILLFSFRKNLFDWPYKAMDSYLRPLKSWEDYNFDKRGSDWSFEEEQVQKVSGLLNENPIALVPSAAWEMKRWPLEHWKQLIKNLSNQNFIVLGGPEDKFCAELEEVDPLRVRNLAGKLNLIESCLAIKSSSFAISGDTGLLQVADLLGIPGVALIGPTAFGFPSGKHIKTLEVNLTCRPCTKDGRGKCSQDVYQRCMVEITPELVAKTVHELSGLN